MFTAFPRVIGNSGVLVVRSFKVPKYNISAASLTSVANRDPNYKRPAPYPYKEKDYGILGVWFDQTSKRFDENTKLIVVDGPIAVGKHDFAKKIAEEFDFHYMPSANMDTYYINSYGFDDRSLNHKLPEELKRLDEKSFSRDPFHINSAWLRIDLLKLRFSEYIDALAHIFNTGQGVVMVRSVYSDLVFLDGMLKEKHIRDNIGKYYHTCRREMLTQLLRPQLVIYLDLPVAKVQERIKKRGRDYEINGKALTTSYLQAMEDSYKSKVLPEYDNHAELLIYDWSDYGDIELVVEDIEEINFSTSHYETKNSDWKFKLEKEVVDHRIQFTNENQKYMMMNMTNILAMDCEELFMLKDQNLINEEVILEAPENQIITGYNADKGDTGILFKTKLKKQNYPYNN